MSFGSENMSAEIRNAVEDACKQNVILLAASGNCGNLKEVSYPAQLDSVFKIFATNEHGFAAGFSPPDDVCNSDYSYFTLGSNVVSTWPSNLQEQARDDGIDLFCYNSGNGHDCSRGGCDVRTVMSGSSFATPIAAALVAIIYQFYDANESLDSRVRLCEESSDRFKTAQAVRVILSKMSKRSRRAKYNVLDPTRGRDNYFKFRPRGQLGQGNRSVRNRRNQTPVQFFSERLTDALDGAI
jgi:subtilisin family serine protease